MNLEKWKKVLCLNNKNRNRTRVVEKALKKTGC